MKKFKWQNYEDRKKEIQELNLTPDEYENKIKELSKRNGF